MPYNVRENTNRSSRNIVGRKSRVKKEIRLRRINRSSWCEYDGYVCGGYCIWSVANRAYRSILYNARLSPWLKREQWKHVLLHVLTHQSRAGMRLSLCFQLLNCRLMLVSRFGCGFLCRFTFFRRLSLHTHKSKISTTRRGGVDDNAKPAWQECLVRLEFLRKKQLYHGRRCWQARQKFPRFAMV